MPAHQSYLSLTGGEVSPYLRHRTDLEKNSSSLERLENLLPIPYGGLRKRPGTVHRVTLAAATRLEPFEYSAALSYLLAFTATGLTVRGSDGTSKDTIVFDYGDPFAIQFAHANDVLFEASPDFHPQLLARTDDTTWTQAAAPFSYPPFLDINPLGEAFTIGLQPSGSTPNWAAATVYAAGANVNSVAAAGADYTCITAHTSSAAGAGGDQPGVGINAPVYWRKRSLKAGQTALLSCPPSFPVFAAGHVGSYWEISVERSLADYEVSFLINASNDGKRSTELVIQGTWSILTYGDWDGTVFLERSKDSGLTWQDYRSWTNDGNRNISETGEEPVRVLMRLRWEQAGAGSGGPHAVLTAGQAHTRGIVRIDSFAIGFTTANVTAITDSDFTAGTDYWREGAFSDYQGYPKAVAIHDGSLIFAGTDRHPVSLWKSKTDDLLNFNPNDGTDADASMFLTLAASTQDPILWLASQRRLFVGTSRTEWVIGSEDSEAPLSPESFLARAYTHYGSAALPALRVNDAVFFVERQRRRLREMAYLLDRESYDAADLTRLAEHISESGIVQMAWQNNREPFLWSVRADGVLLAFAYSRAEQIFAWSRHTTAGGFFRSIAVLRNESDDDEVWTVIEREDGFHLESFARSQQATQEAGGLADCYHVDSGVRDAATDVDLQIDTPPHLDGLQLEVLADGFRYQLTPAAGKLTLPHEADVVQAGLAISSRAIVLPVDTVTDRGATHGLKKRANALNLDLFASRGGSIVYEGQERPIEYDAAADDDLGEAPPLVTGWRDTTFPGGIPKDLQFEIRHESPHPFTVRTAVLDWALNEK